MNDPAFRSPYVPDSAGGLFTAVESAREGDSDALVRWATGRGPVLRKSLERQGFDPALADDALSKVMVEAFVALEEGRAPRDECGWMATVAGNVRLDSKRPRGHRHGPRPTAHGPRPTAHGPRPTAHGPRPTVFKEVSSRRPGTTGSPGWSRRTTPCTSGRALRPSRSGCRLRTAGLSGGDCSRRRGGRRSIGNSPHSGRFRRSRRAG
jgi:hypothetical protein